MAKTTEKKTNKTKPTLSKKKVSEYLKALPFAEFKKMVEDYSNRTNSNFDKEMRRLVTLDHQKRLKEIGVNSTCPQCNSNIIVKNGIKSTGVQKYKCTVCGREFTRFSGTVLEKTRWHWDAWVAALSALFDDVSIQSTRDKLIDDYGCTGIDKKTVWLWRIKLIHALASYPLPTLNGVIQVDETFIRESQKGSRKLESFVKNLKRSPRYGYTPSLCGVMGPEFATVTTIIDDSGHCVCKVSGLGKLTTEQFVDFFHPYIVSPAYLCSDANQTYKEYCRMFDIPHYVKPSAYEQILKEHGCVPIDDTINSRADLKYIEAENQKIVEKLYAKHKIERIDNKGKMSYLEFCTLKEMYGLNLARVNELHNDLKYLIKTTKTNVSTKYLPDYVGYFTFYKNWTVDHGEAPTSLKDAEEILIEILKLRINYTVEDVEKQTIEAPKPTGRYVAMLRAETEKARVATQNKYFKFNEEDRVRTFNKRDYLLDLPEYKFYAICRECKLERGYKKLSTWTVANMLLKHPNINDIIYKTIASDRKNKISDEDLEYIAAEAYKTKFKKAKTPAE